MVTASVVQKEKHIEVLSFSDMVRTLNQETDLEAQKWFRERRKVWLPLVLLKMKIEFFRIYFFEGKCRNGFFGFMQAVHGSLFQLLTYTKYWELMERERGNM